MLTTLLKRECPQGAAAVPAVVPLFTIAGASRVTVQLGAVTGGTFVPGVTLPFVARLLSSLEQGQWRAQTPWSQAIRRHYGDIVTTTEVLADGQYNYTVKHEYVTDAASCTLAWQGTDLPAARGVAQLRAPVPEDDLPERVDVMKRVEIVQHRDFLFSSGKRSRPHWAIDVSMVWSADTYLDALEALRTGAPPTLSVALHCLAPGEVLQHYNGNGNAAALSCVLKTIDLFVHAADIDPAALHLVSL